MAAARGRIGGITSNQPRRSCRLGTYNYSEMGGVDEHIGGIMGSVYRVIITLVESGHRPREVRESRLPVFFFLSDNLSSSVICSSNGKIVNPL